MLKPILTVAQLQRLSNIFDNAGQVIFGVVVLSPFISALFSKFDITNMFVVLSGIVGSTLCWFASVWLAGKGEEK